MEIKGKHFRRFYETGSLKNKKVVALNYSPFDTP
jgi:hypothetical protein